MKKDKLGFMAAILYLAIGLFLYFGYYVLMEKVFKVNPFVMPYLILSIYFVICTLLFPISGHKLSVWQDRLEEKNFFSASLLHHKIIIPFAYVLAPIIFFIKLNKEL